LATQRPSAKVITGTIKANIPSRIAFAVASAIDSRIILDASGAEKLLGRGDMLYSPIGQSKPLRVQGCFISTEEVTRVADYLREQGRPEYHGIEAPLDTKQETEEQEPSDPLLAKAALIFIDAQTASVSFLQRRLKIGYSRAARLVDMLEEKRVVGPSDGSKPREVLMSRLQYEQIFGAEKQE
jgi:S-DNA-T family DNA segregation ATPase FtsK/SpoIIIE